MTTEFITSILPYLPRFAEEESDFYSVPRSALIDGVCQSLALDRTIAENTLATLELLLDTLSVLDRTYLQNGEWCFVSFPAQLLATSILTAMSNGDSRLFPVNFWNTQGIGIDRKNQQHDVLKAIEQARFLQHANQQAQPIRYCYVAWGIVKLDDKILFYLREDTEKRHDPTAGDYGLLGGRANQNDVPSITDKAVLLQVLQSANSQIIKNALPQTLQRELREEAGLQFGEHYRFQAWRSLRPYRQVQGAAPNHALTEYYLDIYLIDLTLEGFLFLQQRIKKDTRLAWFSLSDIETGKSADGKLPYIKALYDEFAGDRAALTAELQALPDSFAAGYLSDSENYSFTLPLVHETPVAAGRPGKHKALDLSLNEQQLLLVLGLAAHLRGFEFSALNPSLNLHPHGWVEVEQKSLLCTALMALAEWLAGSELKMENHQDRWFRLSIRPDTVYFADQLFEFSVHQADLNGVQNKIQALISRQSFITAFGEVQAKTETFGLTLDFAHKLKSLSENQFSADNEKAIKIEDTYKKCLHQNPRFQALGLRNLIRRDAGIIKCVIAYTVI